MVVLNTDMKYQISLGMLYFYDNLMQMFTYIFLPLYMEKKNYLPLNHSCPALF